MNEPAAIMDSTTGVLKPYFINLNVHLFYVFHEINVHLTIGRLLAPVKYDHLEARPVPHESVVNSMR